MHDDWRKLTLATWAKWTADNRPVHFSLHGDSVAAKEIFQPKHKHEYRTDSPLWQDGGTDWLTHLDGRLHGALTAAERRVLFAACIPSGRPCPASERAAAAGVSVDMLRGVRRRAMALID